MASRRFWAVIGADGIIEAVEGTPLIDTSSVIATTDM